jgi:hypothetical protein
MFSWGLVVLVRSQFLLYRVKQIIKESMRFAISQTRTWIERMWPFWPDYASTELVGTSFVRTTLEALSQVQSLH